MSYDVGMSETPIILLIFGDEAPRGTSIHRRQAADVDSEKIDELIHRHPGRPDQRTQCTWGQFTMLGYR